MPAKNLGRALRVDRMDYPGNDVGNNRSYQQYPKHGVPVIKTFKEIAVYWCPGRKKTIQAKKTPARGKYRQREYKISNRGVKRYLVGKGIRFPRRRQTNMRDGNQKM